MKPNETPTWLSVLQLASYLGVSKETVYRWLKVNCVPTQRLGKLWKFKKSEIDQWMKKQKRSKN